MSEQPRKRPGLARDKNGAAMLEFLIAIVPLCAMFLTFCQLALVYTAHLVVQHSASAGARAAAVITNDPVNPGKHGTPEDVTRAVKIALGPWYITQSLLLEAEPEVTDASSDGDPAGMVTVTVRTNYQCIVPLGQLICSGGGALLRQASIVSSASFPHQGAKYKISECDKEAQGELGNSGGGSSLGTGGGPDLTPPAPSGSSSASPPPTPPGP